MIDRGKHDVIGVQINAVDYSSAVERVVQAARDQQSLTVSALAVHGVMTGVLDPEHRYRLNQFDMLVPDGQPVRWALRLLHRINLPDRVYGPNLMLKLCERAAESQLPIFLYGSTAEVLDALQKKLRERFPNVMIAGSKPSLFRRMTTDERDALAAEIRASGARLTFVALGCPRQEVFAYEMRSYLNMPLLAVGAAFPFHAGLLQQAPRFYQDRGLEWFYRLMAEPRRLWRRYLLLNPLYVSLLMRQFLTRKVATKPSVAPTVEMLYG